MFRRLWSKPVSMVAPWMALALLVAANWFVHTDVQADPACVETHQVKITYKFNPQDLTIRAGDCVRWENIHGIEHSAVGIDREFNTGILMPGGTALRQFNEAGAIPYICGVHPPMTAVLIIEPREVGARQ